MSKSMMMETGLIATADAVNTLVQACHSRAFNAGWWHDIETGEKLDRDPLVLLGLIHTEISEAFEGARKDLMDDHLPDRKMVEVELADALIRICDMAGGLGYDLAGAVADKLEYNAKREDHKPENRKKDGGKKV